MSTLQDLGRTSHIGHIPVTVRHEQRTLYFEDRRIQTVPIVVLRGETNQQVLKMFCFKRSDFFPDSTAQVVGVYRLCNLETGSVLRGHVLENQNADVLRTFSQPPTHRGNALLFNRFLALDNEQQRQISDWVFTLRSPSLNPAPLARDAMRMYPGA